MYVRGIMPLNLSGVAETVEGEVVAAYRDPSAEVPVLLVWAAGKGRFYELPARAAHRIENPAGAEERDM
jgi:hypothetical protein